MNWGAVRLLTCIHDSSAKRNQGNREGKIYGRYEIFSGWSACSESSQTDGLERLPGRNPGSQSLDTASPGPDTITQK